MSSFVSELGNKQALDIIEKLKNPAGTIIEKMDALEWVIKNLR
jgi:hypothetical protein